MTFPALNAPFASIAAALAGETDHVGVTARVVPSLYVAVQENTSEPPAATVSAPPPIAIEESVTATLRTPCAPALYAPAFAPADDVAPRTKYQYFVPATADVSR